MTNIMASRIRWSAAMALALAACATPAAAEPAAANATSCDRTCLTGFMEQYLDALAARDPSRLKKAVQLRFTEDGQELELGDGFWGTASARGSYRHYFPDPRTGNIGFFGTMRENGNPVLLVARLKVVSRKIAEIETIVSRGASPIARAGVERLEKMQRPEAIWNEDVPPAQRMSRADLIRTANKYFSGLQNNKPNGDYSFFADDCDRLENGIRTTNATDFPAAADGSGPQPGSEGLHTMSLGCRAQFTSGFFQMVTRIRDRRFLAVDEEKGVVFAMGFFDHSGQVRQQTLADGRTLPVDIKAPFTWEMGEAFKITHGQIRRVEAVMKQSPYGMPSGWHDPDPGYDLLTGP